MSEAVHKRSAEELVTIANSIPYAAYIGLEISQDSDGTVVSHLPFRADIVGNPSLPAIHGGMVGAFLELASLFELLSRSDTGRFPKPINFNVNYLRSARPVDLYAKAQVVKHGRRMANVEVRAWQTQESEPVASGWGNFLV